MRNEEACLVRSEDSLVQGWRESRKHLPGGVLESLSDEVIVLILPEWLIRGQIGMIVNDGNSLVTYSSPPVRSRDRLSSARMFDLGLGDHRDSRCRHVVYLHGIEISPVLQLMQLRASFQSGGEDTMQT